MMDAFERKVLEIERAYSAQLRAQLEAIQEENRRLREHMAVSVDTGGRAERLPVA